MVASQYSWLMFVAFFGAIAVVLISTGPEETGSDPG